MGKVNSCDHPMPIELGLSVKVDDSVESGLGHGYQKKSLS
jgi:hypothetical protein